MSLKCEYCGRLRAVDYEHGCLGCGAPATSPPVYESVPASRRRIEGMEYVRDGCWWTPAEVAEMVMYGHAEFSEFSRIPYAHGLLIGEVL